MKVRVLTPGAVLFDDEAVEAALPGIDGVFAVWDFHQDAVCALAGGDVVLRRRDAGDGRDIQTVFPIACGVARVRDGALVVMAEAAAGKL